MSGVASDAGGRERSPLGTLLRTVDASEDPAGVAGVRVVAVCLAAGADLEGALVAFDVDLSEPAREVSVSVCPVSWPREGAWHAPDGFPIGAVREGRAIRFRPASTDIVRAVRDLREGAPGGRWDGDDGPDVEACQRVALRCVRAPSELDPASIDVRLDDVVVVRFHLRHLVELRDWKGDEARAPLAVVLLGGPAIPRLFPAADGPPRTVGARGPVLSDAALLARTRLDPRRFEPVLAAATTAAAAIAAAFGARAEAAVHAAADDLWDLATEAWSLTIGPRPRGGGRARPAGSRRVPRRLGT